MRIGQGYDVHALVQGRKLVVGGVTIPFEKGLAGHSDADVLIHAVCDALLGAAALGDIGLHFPDTDPKHRNANSRAFLREVAKKVRLAGFSIVNLDATIIAQAPKMAPHTAAMVANLAADLEIDLGQVNIKAKTAERLGAIGRGEGIAAEAIALLDSNACNAEPRMNGIWSPGNRYWVRSSRSSSSTKSNSSGSSIWSTLLR